MIAPTIDIARAAETVWDVVVIGAGPAGALAARECVRGGLLTLFVDKSSFPRYKVCGCCVNARARHALARVGLGTLLEDLGAVPLHAFFVASGGRIARIPLPEGYVSLSRERFDMALVREAIRAGAQFLPEVKAALGEAMGESREVVLRATHRSNRACDANETEATLNAPTPKRVARLGVPPRVGVIDVRANGATLGGTLKAALALGVASERVDPDRRVHARLVLAANGLGRGIVAEDDVVEGSRVGIGTVVDTACDDYAWGVTYMACARRGYLGLQRIEDGRLDVAAAVDAAWMRSVGGAADAAMTMLDEAGLPALDFDDVLWKGTPPLTRRPSAMTLPRVLALGDAAGYVEPFTGEGMAWALSSAAAVAPVAVRAAAQYDAAIERVWQECYRELVTRRQWICKAMAAGLRRPLLVSMGVRAVSVVPALARPLIRAINRTPPDARALLSSA